MLMLKTAIDQVVAGGFVKRDVLGKGGESLSETGGCASFIFLSCGAYHISCYLHTYTYYCFLSGSDCLKIQNHQNHKPAFMINRTCEDLKPLLAATGSHFDTGVGPWQLSNRRFDEISEMVKPHSERVQISTSALGIISDLCSRILMGYEWPQKAPSGDDAHSPSSWLRHHKSN